jgi:hypothetical protein
MRFIGGGSMRSRSSVRSLIPLAALALTSTLACGTGAPSAGDVNHDVVREPIVGGARDTTHSAVVALLLADTTNPNSFGACSGSIVKVASGVGYVLTAAHCCGGDPQSAGMRPNIVVAADDYENYEQDLGNPHPAAPAYAVVASSVKFDQAYNGNDHDFCMLQFTGAPATMPTVKLPTATDGLTLGAAVEFVGFGDTQVVAQNSERYHVSSTVDTQLTSAVLKYSEGQGGRGGPCEGDSGGPALFPAGAPQTQQTVVGTTSYGDQNCAQFGVSSRVSSAVGPTGFITTYLAGTPQPPSPTGSSTCEACQDRALSAGGACESKVVACENSAPCSSLVTCLQGCDPSDSACPNACASTNSKGVNGYLAIDDCLCGTGCATECASECKTAPADDEDAGASDGKGKKTDAGSLGEADEDPESAGTAAAGDPANGAAPRSGYVQTTTAGCSVSATGRGDDGGRGRTLALTGWAAFATLIVRRRRARRCP